MLTPFAIITVYAFFRHLTLGPTPPAHGSLLTGMLVAMWNYMGWDNASTVANEVDNPQRTYPRVMILALVAIMLSYIVPVAAIWHTHLQLENWSSGSWASIAGIIVAPWLSVALVAAAMVSTFGSFNSLVMSYSRLPVAMAEEGQLPRLFARKLANGAPWVAIIVLGTAWGLSLGLSFDRLIMLDILLYGAILVLEFLALIMLRIREPELHRPFRIPGGLPVAVLVAVGPTVLLGIALVKNRNEQLGHISALTLGVAMMALGVISYFAFGRKTGITQPLAAKNE